jgi:hypothetical protein
MRITAGPSSTMKIVGMMHSSNGKRIFTGSFIALSSARWRRLILSSEAWIRSTRATGTP